MGRRKSGNRGRRAGVMWAVGLAGVLAAAGAAAVEEAQYKESGELESVRVDADGDGRWEARERYVEGRRVEREEDRDGDGIFERRFLWNLDGSTDLWEGVRGEPVRRTRYDRQGVRLEMEEDADRDGSFESRWRYAADGTLREVWRSGSTWRYREGRLRRAELDEDRDGTVDRVEHYDRDEDLEKVEERRGDRTVRLWHYAEGAAVRMQGDSDGDGRLDTEHRFGPDGRTTQLIDRDGDGLPEVRQVLGAGGKVLLREEDWDRDGAYELRLGREGGGG